MLNKDLWLGNFLLSISTGMFASFFVLIIDRGIKKNDTIKEYEKEILGKQLGAIKALSNYCDYIYANYEILNKKDIMNFSLLYEDFCNDSMPKTMSIILNENGEILRYKENYYYILNEHKKICLDNDTSSLCLFVKNTAQKMEDMQDITSNLIWEYDKYFKSKLKRLI